MRLRICGVYKLTGNEAARNLTRQLLRLGDGTFHALCAIGEDELGTVCLHYLTALDRHCFGHNDDDTIASCRGNGGKTYACISRGRLDDYGAFFEKSFLFRIVNHSLCHSVLDGACGIEIFELGYDFCLQPELFFNMRKLKKRSFTDELIGAFIDF